MFNIKVDYPSYDEEKRILEMAAKDEVVEIAKILSTRAIVNMQKLVRGVPVGDFAREYALHLVRGFLHALVFAHDSREAVSFRVFFPE